MRSPRGDRAGGIRTRVLVVHTHPVQYLAPLFRRYSTCETIDLTVAYCFVPPDDGFSDADFGQKTDWGVDLVSGYQAIELRRPVRFLPRLNPSVWSVIRRGDFDLVLSYGYSFPTAWISLVAAKAAGTRWAFVTDNFTLASQNGKHRLGKATFLRVIAKLSDAVVTASVRSERFYREFAPAKTFLVPHAVDDELFRTPQKERADTRAPVFLYVGKLIPRKRVHDLINAASQIPGARVRIVGTGPERERLEALAQPISDRVEFFGFLTQRALRDVYQESDVLVLPSEIETYGLVANEAASMGCALISSDACGVVDSLLVDNVTGFVYAVGNVDELCSAMTQMQDPTVRGRLNTALSERLTDWSVQANVSAFVRTVATVAGVQPD